MVAEHQHKSFCRICTGHCGIVARVNDDGRLEGIRGDREDPQTKGFICSKGTDAVDSHNNPERILRPLKRQPDGRFAPIALDQALAEISERVGDLVSRHGPRSVATYRGSGGFMTATSLQIQDAFMDALGSPQKYSNLTIDQSAKWVALGRLGWWPAGPQTFDTSDVCMLVGNNPLVSIAGSGFDTRHPLKRLRDAKARGMKLIVIDPRRTETAEYADVFIQPLPGNDTLILAAIIRIILGEGWHDQAFCQQHVADVDALAKAVEPFTPAFVAEVADIPAESLWQAAAAFARDGKRGTVTTATGPSMSPFCNTMEQMAGCLNAICGRFVREGEPIANPGLLLGWMPKPAQVMAIGRSWEAEPKSRFGDYGTIGGEMLTGLLADEILTPGEGQIRCLFSVGGNPAAAVPDHHKMAKALESLDLLVCMEPFMTATAALADYILPPRMQYERADLNLALFETAIYLEPYARYTPAVVQVPADSELCDEWFAFWTIARGLGLGLSCNGVELDMNTPPSDDDLLSILARNAPVDWQALKSASLGYRHPETMVAAPADPATASRFTLVPSDVGEELTQVLDDGRERLAERGQGPYPFRLATRRSRHRFNTVGHQSPYLRKLVPYNPAYLNPGDMASLGLKDDDWIDIVSDHDQLRARAMADDSVRPGVVSMTHCFGYLPGDNDYDRHGVSTNLLISTDRDMQSISAMPRMSAIPVAIRPAGAAL